MALSTIAPELSAQSVKAGDRFELQLKRHSEDHSESNGARGTSDDTDTLVERVVAVGEQAQDLEFDLPSGASADERLGDWKFPVRIRASADGTRILLNQADLESRRDAFLKASELDPKACGKWIFTWNAFKIECDPQSALHIVEAYEIQPMLLANGAPFKMKGGVGSAPMKCIPTAKKGQECSVQLEVDADAVRSELASIDVALGEITGKPISAADAAKQRASVQISGTINVTFDANSDGMVWRRTVVTRSEQREPDGKTSTSISTAVLTRRKI
jgi:hypothetical protein